MTACIEWEGTLSTRGYALVYVPGHHHMKNAHRVLYERVHGAIPDGWVVHHLCENKACVNLDHLVAMSRAAHAEAHARTACNRCGGPLDYREGGRGGRRCLPCYRERKRRYAQQRRAEVRGV